MTQPTCQSCDCVAGCQSRARLCPNLVEKADGTLIGEGTKAAIAQPEQTAMLSNVDLEPMLTKFAVAAIRWGASLISDKEYLKEKTELRDAVNSVLAAASRIAQPEQQTERNFCAHCGKRLSGDGIHTCTPPKDKP